MQENRIVEPNFIVNDEGRVSCTKHTLFNKPRENVRPLHPPILNLFAPPQQPPPLTCKSCGHYIDDTCYFAPQSIDQILYQRDRGQIICDFCGDKITRSMGVLQKIYFENKFGVKMPLVCCECFANLKKEDFVHQSQINLFWWVVKSIITLTACFVFLVFPGGAIGLLFYVPLWVWFSYNNIRKSYFTWRGMKRYQELEAKLK